MTVEEISPVDAAAAIAAGAFLLDVRNDDEWEAGHSSLATYVTLSQVPDRVGELPADTTIIVICRAGGRSLKAAEFLDGAGYSAKNLTGGMQAWAASGLDVVTDAGDPGTVI